MIRYKVLIPFVDYGMYHGVGDIISDSSYINSKEVKLQNGTLEIINDDTLTPEVPVAVTASEVTVTPAQVAPKSEIKVPEPSTTSQPKVKPVIPNLVK